MANGSDNNRSNDVSNVRRRLKRKTAYKSKPKAKAEYAKSVGHTRKRTCNGGFRDDLEVANSGSYEELKNNIGNGDKEMSKNIDIKKIPTKLKELLETGLLKNVQVTYQKGAKAKQKPRDGLRGVVKGLKICCSCPKCHGRELVSPNEFEKHAHSANKRPTDYIYLDNGKSLRDILNACKDAHLDNLKSIINNMVGRLCTGNDLGENGESSLTGGGGDEVLPCHSQTKEPHLNLTSVPGNRLEKTPSLDSSNIDVACNLQEKGKIKRKNIELPKSVIENDNLPDETPLFYDSHKEVRTPITRVQEVGECSTQAEIRYLNDKVEALEAALEGARADFYELAREPAKRENELGMRLGEAMAQLESVTSLRDGLASRYAALEAENNVLQGAATQDARGLALELAKAKGELAYLEIERKVFIEKHQETDNLNYELLAEVDRLKELLTRGKKIPYPAEWGPEQSIPRRRRRARELVEPAAVAPSRSDYNPEIASLKKEISRLTTEVVRRDDKIHGLQERMTSMVTSQEPALEDRAQNSREVMRLGEKLAALQEAHKEALDDLNLFRAYFVSHSEAAALNRRISDLYGADITDTMMNLVAEQRRFGARVHPTLAPIAAKYAPEKPASPTSPPA